MGLDFATLKKENLIIADKFRRAGLEYSTHSEPHRPALRATHSII